MAEDIVKVRYGRKKLDAEAYATQEEAAHREGREATRFGARKFDTEKTAPAKRGGRSRVPDDPSTPPKEPERAPTGSLPSIPKLRALLTKSPAQLDAAIEVELKQDAPRKGAIHLFHEIETGKGDEARPEVLAKLDAALSSFEE